MHLALFYGTGDYQNTRALARDEVKKMAFIEVADLVKEYKIFKNNPGVLGAVKSLFHREYTTKTAVNRINFSIERSDIVGYIGPNGAGKSTTIKMLSGILVPTSGSVSIGGNIPYKNRKENAKRIGVVFGQRSQLYWDLPISDTFDLYKRMYDIPTDVYEKNLRFYIEVLDMGGFINQPVRQLSLGQKMKANIAIAMIHDPEVLYLDEPTIGLDVVSKRTLRNSIKSMNAEKNTTIMLTTHDMDDIEAVCNRLILIDKGEKLFDGLLSEFKTKYENGFIVKMIFDTVPIWQDDKRYILEHADETTWTIRTTNGLSTKEAFLSLIERYNPQNIFVEEQQIEDIIANLFKRD